MKEERKLCGKRVGMTIAVLLCAMLCAFAVVGCAKGKTPAYEHGHVYVEHAATNSTCTVAGNDLYYTCEGCDKIFDADKNEIAAIPTRALVNHVWNEGVKTADADCEHGDTYTLTCSVGGETKTEYRGDPLGHSWGEYTVTANDVQATCMQEGTETATCNRCHQTDTRTTGFAPHDYGTEVPQQNAQIGNSTTKCSTGLYAHYQCSVCEKYFTGEGTNKTQVTLDSLTIPAPHDYVWQHDDYKHKHVCSHCNDVQDEAAHTFTNVPDTTCSVCHETVSDRILAAFTDNASFATTNECPPDMNGGIYSLTVTDLPSGKPSGYPSVGNKALKLETTAVEWWNARVAIPIGNLLHDATVNAADKITLYGYRTGDRYGDGFYVLGDVTGGVFDGRQNGQLLTGGAPKTAIAAESGAGWFTLTWTVKELKAAQVAQGNYSAHWMLIEYNMPDNSTETDDNHPTPNAEMNEAYFYALKFERETARTITNNANTKVTVNENAVPLQEVTVTANTLTSGECVYVRETVSQKIVAMFLMGGGTFIMPYADVTVTVENLFDSANTDVVFTDIGSALYNVETLALPDLYDEWADAGYTVAVTGEVPAADYVFDNDNKTIYFTKSGVYTLSYTLSRTGEQAKTYSRAVTVRDVLAAFENDADVAGRSNWNNEREYTSELVSLPANIGKPSGAKDAGEKVWKFTEKAGDNYYYTPTIYLGEFLNNLDGFADDDYIRVWMYRGAMYGDNRWMLGNVDGNNIFWDTNENANMPNQSRNNMKVLGEAGTWNLGAVNTWGALDISVAELRAQLSAQGNTDAHYLQLRLNTAPEAVNYIYSVELRHREGVIAAYANGMYTRYARFNDNAACELQKATLSTEILESKPSTAPDVGSDALAVTAHGDGIWNSGVALYLGNVLNDLDTLDDNDYISLWTYFVDNRYGDNQYWLGNLQQNSFNPNYAYNSDTDSSKGTSLGDGRVGGQGNFLKGWQEIRFTVADLKAAKTKCGEESAKWMAIMFNTTPENAVYVYATEFHKAANA